MENVRQIEINSAGFTREHDMFRFAFLVTDGEKSVWSEGDTDTAMEAAKSLYGNNASVAAAWCALAARCDGRTTDYRFWFQIFERLQDEISGHHDTDGH